MPPQPRAANRRAGRKPSVERLEGRRCLTATAGLLADGTLLISGDNRVDSIEIVDVGLGTIGLNGNFRSFGFGAAGDFSGDFDVLFGGVTRIAVDLRGGNDVVAYRSAGDLVAPRVLEMDLGSGNDRVAIEAGDVGGANFAVSVELGRGNDRLNAELFGDLVNSYVQLDVDGGPGNDDIGLLAVDLYLDNSATLDTILAGGDGNDLVTGELSLNSGSTGLLGISTLGGRGNDRLALEVYQTEGLAAGSSGYLDGGAGRDVFFATPEIRVVSAEPVSRRRR